MEFQYLFANHFVKITFYLGSHAVSSRHWLQGGGHPQIQQGVPRQRQKFATYRIMYSAAGENFGIKLRTRQIFSCKIAPQAKMLIEIAPQAKILTKSGAAGENVDQKWSL